MADEPLIRRVATINATNTSTPRLVTQFTSGYLDLSSPRRISTFKLNNNDKTLNTGDTSTPRLVKQVTSGYLDLRSPTRVSTFNFNNNDKTLALITKDILTPRSVTTSTQEKIAKYVINFHRSRSAPALYTEEKGLIHRDSFAPKRRRLTAPQLVLVALLGLLVYIIVGIAVFSFANESFNGRKTNKFIDAIYFTIVTLSTIGYGDIVPATTFTKLFTCLFIIVGFGFVDTLLNALVTYVLDLQEGVLLGAVDQNQFIKMIETYVFDKKKKRMRIRTKMSLALGVVTLSLVIGTVTLHFMEDMSWVDSFYLSVTSVTTVGYGDHAFETAAGRCFAIVWLLISTLAVARALMYLVEYRIQKRNQRMANLVLQKKLTLGDFVAADLDHDGSISKAEYVVYKLREMGKIDEKDIVEICEQFETKESPDHSKITVADLMEGGTESKSTKLDAIKEHEAR